MQEMFDIIEDRAAADHALEDVMEALAGQAEMSHVGALERGRGSATKSRTSLRRAVVQRRGRWENDGPCAHERANSQGTQCPSSRGNTGVNRAISVRKRFQCCLFLVTVLARFNLRVKLQTSFFRPAQYNIWNKYLQIQNLAQQSKGVRRSKVKVGNQVERSKQDARQRTMRW